MSSVQDALIPTQTAEKSPRTVRSLAGTSARATILFVTDALFLNQGLLAVLVGAWLLLFALPKALFSMRYENLRGPRLRNLGVYSIAVAAVLVFNSAVNTIAHQRAEALVQVIERYHKDYGNYPETLATLVPRYLKSIAKPKPLVIPSRFIYLTSKHSPMLLYEEFPPFGRAYYNFTLKAWDRID